MNRQLEWLQISVDRRPFRNEFFSAAVSLATIEGEFFRYLTRGQCGLAEQCIVPMGTALDRLNLALCRYSKAGGELEGLPYLLRQGLLARRIYPVRERLCEQEARAAAPLIERKLNVFAALNSFALAMHIVVDGEVDEILRKTPSARMASATCTEVRFDQLMEESGHELDLIDKAVESCERANAAVNTFLIASESWFGGRHRLPESWQMLTDYFQFPQLEEGWDDIRTTTWTTYKNSEAP